MKLKIVVVDFEIPMRVKKWAIRAGIPAVILTVAAVAYADSLHTWNTGDTLQATDLNGNFSNLQAQITAQQAQAHPASAFRAERTTTLNVPNGTSTNVVFDNVLFDLASEYNATTGAFTAKNAGTYLVTCSLQWNVTTTPGLWNVSIGDSKGQFTGYDLQANNYAGSTQTSATMQIAAGDVVYCQAYQSTGVSQPLAIFESRNAFSVMRIY